MERTAVNPATWRRSWRCGIDNLEAVLGEAGMSVANLVRLHVYTTDVDQLFQHYGVLAARLSVAGVATDHHDAWGDTAGVPRPDGRARGDRSRVMRPRRLCCRWRLNDTGSRVDGRFPVLGVVTIGVSGRDGESLPRRRHADGGLLLDVRQWRGVRGPGYAWGTHTRARPNHRASSAPLRRGRWRGGPTEILDRADITPVLPALSSTEVSELRSVPSAPQRLAAAR